MNEVIEPVAVVHTQFPCRGRTGPRHLYRGVRVTPQKLAAYRHGPSKFRAHDRVVVRWIDLRVIYNTLVYGPNYPVCLQTLLSESLLQYLLVHENPCQQHRATLVEASIVVALPEKIIQTCYMRLVHCHAIVVRDDSCPD